MIERLAATLAIPIPDRFDFMAAGAAAAAVTVALLIGWAAGRWIGPRLAALLERRAGARGEGMAARLCGITRNFTVWLLLATALQVHEWPPLATFILGLVGGLAAALVVVDVVRGLQVARLIAYLLGTLAFVGVFAEAVGGLQTMTRTLDGIALAIGTRRVSMLNLLQIAVGLALLYLAVRLATRIVSLALKASHSFDPAQRLLAEKLAGVAILAIAFFIALGIVGIDFTALAVFGGAFGLAIGFGLQKTIGNLFAGIVLLMDRSIKPGDVIVVGESFGQVTKIGVRAVSVVTRDGKEHLIPNEDLMTREVENWSYSSKDVRIHIPVGVAYGSDLLLAQRLMIEAAQASQRVLKVPQPSVWLRGFGDSSVDHDILVWISDPEKGVGNVQSEILNRLWLLFRDHKVEIPFPQTDIYVKEWPNKPPLAAASEAEQAPEPR